jgi:hypothetical protein
MGTPTNLLPNNLYFNIGESYPSAIPYTHLQGFPAYEVPCDTPLGTFDYIFSNYTIKVSFQDSLYKDNVNGVCTFGFTLGLQGEQRLWHSQRRLGMDQCSLPELKDGGVVWSGKEAKQHKTLCTYSSKAA